MELKKLIKAVILLAAMHSRLHGQGTLSFDNIFTAVNGPPAPVTISTFEGTFNPSDGQPGAYVGSNYTASLFFLNGTITDQALFDSMSPVLVATADTKFFGTTGTGPGHGFSGDGSGFFQGPVVYLGSATSREVTVQVRAWYNGDGVYTSYAQASAAGHNVGESTLIPLMLGLPPSGDPNMDCLAPFAVGVPEPSTFALVLLGAASLLLLRRPHT